MKKLRVFLIALSCLTLLGICTACPVPAASAKKYRNELVKVKIKGSDPKDYNYYFYDKKGKKLKSAWKKVKVKGKYRKFYFGKNGKAYKAKKVQGFKNNVIVKKVKGVQYGFDANGYLVSGLFVTAGFDGGKLYYFDQKGRVDKAVTSKLQKAAKQGADAETLKDLLKKYAGKKKNSYTTTVCTLFNGVEPKSAAVDQYAGFEAQYFLMPDDSEIVYLVVGTLS